MGALDDLLSEESPGGALDRLLANAQPPSLGRKLATGLIREAVRLPTQPGPIQKGFERFVAQHRLETALGTTIGALAGGIPGAALGTGAGEALAQLREGGPGGVPAARRIGQQAVIGAGSEALGLGLGRGLKAIGRAAGAAEEARNVIPTNLRQFFGIPQKSAEALVEDPRAVIKAASLGPKGTTKLASDTVNEARKELPRLISSSNQEYGKVVGAMVSKTKGQTIIPTNQILVKVESELPAYGFDPRIKSVDPLGLSKIRTILGNIRTLANKVDGKISVIGFNRLRVQINAAMGNPRISTQAREVLDIIKGEMDESLISSVGDDLSGAFSSVLEKNSRAREINKALSPVISGKNAPQNITKAIEAGDETGQILEEFEALSGNKFLEPIKTAIRALPFSRNVPILATEGGAGALAMRGPAALASSVPFIGRVFRPPAIAAATSALLAPTQAQRQLLFKRPVQAIAQRVGEGLFAGQQ